MRAADDDDNDDRNPIVVYVRTRTRAWRQASEAQACENSTNFTDIAAYVSLNFYAIARARVREQSIILSRSSPPLLLLMLPQIERPPYARAHARTVSSLVVAMAQKNMRKSSPLSARTYEKL